MSGCDREQGTHYQCDCIRERMQRLEGENAELRERCADFARAQAKAVKQRNEDRERLEAVLRALRVALRVAQHELDTIHGLFASDDPTLIDHTPAGVWRLDLSTAREVVDDALSSSAGKQENQGDQMDSWDEARRYSALDERDVRIKELEQENAELRQRVKVLEDELKAVEFAYFLAFDLLPRYLQEHVIEKIEERRNELSADLSSAAPED